VPINASIVSCRVYKPEAAGLTAPLHARLVFNLGAHQAREKSYVEAADFRIVFREVVVNAVFAFDTRQFVGVGRGYGFGLEPGS
jgi:hypothetical protein